MILALGITPACAGSTAQFQYLDLGVQDHPCLRGEYLRRMYHHFITIGSPLLARGVLKSIEKPLIFKRITPACAGSTVISELYKIVFKDHPCLRGEYFIVLYFFCYLQGSPLLARGVPLCEHEIAIGDGITPACAGST